MNYLNKYDIRKEHIGTWTIFIKGSDEVFQECFDSKEEALEFLQETFG